MDTNNIPPGGGEVNPKENKPSRQWKYLARIEERFMSYLFWQWNVYRKQKRLQPDGSFYGTNESYQKLLGATERTLSRLKKRLQDKGLIRFITNQGRGQATYYFILDTTPKETKAEPKKPENRPPLDKERVKNFARKFGGALALTQFQHEGYSLEEVKLALNA